MKTVKTENQFKEALQACKEYAESNNHEEYYAQAAEVLEMLIEGL